MAHELHTERLKLRHFTYDDVDFVIEILNQPSFIEFIGDRMVRSIEEAKKYILERFIQPFNNNGYTMMLVESNETNESLGMCGLVNREGLDIPDLGFAFLESCQGNGYAYEASNLIIQNIRDDLNLYKIAAVTKHDNIASVNLLVKLRFQFKREVELFENQEKLMLFEKQLN